MARKANKDNYHLQTVISVDAAAYLAKLAEANDRSMIKYVKRIVMGHLESNGYVENSNTNNPNDFNHGLDAVNDSQKKNSFKVDAVVKQSANCNSISATTKMKKNIKVAPLQL